MESLHRFCWICEKLATTAEHKFKRSTLRALYLDGRNRGEAPAFFFARGKLTAIRGSNSAQLRFSKSICRQCNNVLTQRFDTAFDKLRDFLLARRLSLQDLQFLNWTEVFGEDWAAGKRDVVLYFAKLLGCEITAVSAPVPRDLCASLLTGNPDPAITFYLAVNRAELRIDPWNTSLGHFGLHALQDRKTTLYTGYSYGQSIGCFEFHILFNYPSSPSWTGSQVLADGSLSKIGVYDHLRPEREEFVRGAWRTPEHTRRIEKTPLEVRVGEALQRIMRLQEIGVPLSNEDQAFVETLKMLVE